MFASTPAQAAVTNCHNLFNQINGGGETPDGGGLFGVRADFTVVANDICTTNVPNGTAFSNAWVMWADNPAGGSLKHIQLGYIRSSALTVRRYFIEDTQCCFSAYHKYLGSPSGTSTFVLTWRLPPADNYVHAWVCVPGGGACTEEYETNGVDSGGNAWNPTTANWSHEKGEFAGEVGQFYSDVPGSFSSPESFQALGWRNGSGWSPPSASLVQFHDGAGNLYPSCFQTQTLGSGLLVYTLRLSGC